MHVLPHLFENNRHWAERINEERPDFFASLARQQSPDYLWIGCADSRVPANEIVGLMPGELFVHRNVANLVVHTDLNCLSVLQYAVEVLQVGHVIVCDHYGCGGVQAAMGNTGLGLIDNWLLPIKDVYAKHHRELSAIANAEDRLNRFVELNVVAQVNNVCHTTIVQNAWQRGQELAVHGWVYGLSDGLLRDLNICITGKEKLPEIYRMATDGAG